MDKEKDGEPGYSLSAEELAAIPLAVTRRFEQEADSNPWQALDEARNLASHFRTWPPYVFADEIAYNLAVRKAFQKNYPEPSEILLRAHALSLYGPWRITRGIYCFDSELSTALAQTDSTAEIPVDVLLRLPEWSICIFGEGLSSDSEIACIFASLTYTVPIDGPNTTYLRIMGVYKNTALDINTIILEPGTNVQQSVESALKSTNQITEMKAYARDASDQQQITDLVSRALAHILYLCADEPDMDAVPPRPLPHKTKAGPRFFPPESGSRMTSVGARIGAQFRRTRAEFAAAEVRAKTGRTMPPHWRKAHWSHFWIGPRKAETRSQIVKWIAPTFVNATTDELPVVVRPVREEGIPD